MRAPIHTASLLFAATIVSASTEMTDYRFGVVEGSEDGAADVILFSGPTLAPGAAL